MRTVLLLILLASPVYACCPVDRHTLADEADEALLDVIAGKVERDPFSDLRVRLLKDPAGTLDTDAETRTRLALTLWWLGGAAEFTPERCLQEAATATKELADAAEYEGIIRWAKLQQRADPDSFLPDFFDLRYATGKTADTDTGALKQRGLDNAEGILLELLKLDPAWENFDSIYALSMVYMVQGRQNLAQYTRKRAWEMHEAGQYSRVPGAAAIADIKPLTIVRQPRADTLVPVKLVSEENDAVINTQYSARRAYAMEWNTARDEALRQFLASGSAQAIWPGFTPPPAHIPPLRQQSQPETPAVEPDAKPNESHAAEPPPKSRTQTWIMLGVLGLMLALGALAKSRAARGEPKPEESA